MGTREKCRSVSKPITPGDDIAHQIILTLSDATGNPPSAIPPLGDSLDFQTLYDLTVDNDVSTIDEFEHAGCVVRIEGDEIVAEPP